MMDLIVWTVILVIVDVLYLIYERNELNPNNASNYEEATEMIKERNRNRTFFIGLNIFVLGIWIKGIQKVTGLFFMTIGAIIAFFGK